MRVYVQITINCIKEKMEGERGKKKSITINTSSRFFFLLLRITCVFLKIKTKKKALNEFKYESFKYKSGKQKCNYLKGDCRLGDILNKIMRMTTMLYSETVSP